MPIIGAQFVDKFSLYVGLRHENKNSGVDVFEYIAPSADVPEDSPQMHQCVDSHLPCMAHLETQAMVVLTTKLHSDQVLLLDQVVRKLHAVRNIN